MLERTATYDVERVKLRTVPRYFLRFYHVPDQRQPEHYAFSVDFAGPGVIKASSKPKIRAIERLGSMAASIVPEQGRSSISATSAVMTDLDGAVLKYFSFPQLAIRTAIDADDDRIYIKDVNFAPGTEGLPDPPCTIEISAYDTSDLSKERIRYQTKNDEAGYVENLTRGADDTTARAWAANDLVTNGEQIRPGQRVVLFCGYDPLPEEDYLEMPMLQVVERSLAPFTQAGYQITMADILRFVRTEAFLGASADAPLHLEGHPFDIALQILLSTGTGTNTEYDVLTKEDGLGIPSIWIDVEGIEAARDLFPDDVYCFDIRDRASALEWLETEIWKPTNAYPVIIQGGRLTFRSYIAPLPEPVEVELSEALGLSESLATSVTAGGGGVADTLGLSEDLTATVGDAEAETLGLTESAARATARGIAESLGLTENLDATVGKSLAESLGLTEDMEEDPTLFRNMQNLSGGSLALGDVVIVSDPEDTVELSDVSGKRSLYVVALETIANTATGRFALPNSVVTMQVAGTVTATEWLKKSATTKAAEGTSLYSLSGDVAPNGTIAMAITARTGAGTITALLLPPK